jgi:hypothetical protein
LRAFDLRGFDFCFLILRAGMASAVVFDERLVAILMQHFLADERAGWGGGAAPEPSEPGVRHCVQGALVSPLELLLRIYAFAD